MRHMSMINFTKTALKNFFSKPATRPYPAVPRLYPERTRGSIGIDIDTCIFCGICSKKCPTGTISVSRDTKTWQIRPFGCTQCGECVSVCPKKCLTMLQNYTIPNEKKTEVSYTQVQKPTEPQLAEKNPDTKE